MITRLNSIINDKLIFKSKVIKLKFLITGGLGFIGSSLIRKIIKETDHQVLNLDKQTYASNILNLKSIELDERYNFIKGDICDEILIEKLLFDFQPDYLMHLAAESHVDNSINNPSEFIRTNIFGTFSLLKNCHQYWKSLPKKKKETFKFHHISTDEVYGSQISRKLFNENSRYDPSSPYAASKASSDHLVRAWFKTYNIPILISNCSNNYGPYQFPEKLIPLTILNAIQGKKIPIYGNGLQVRDWLHVEDHCSALLDIISKGKTGETYNVGGNNQIKNIDIVKKICSVLDSLGIDKPPGSKSFRDLITYVNDRPGHDLMYGIDAQKIYKDLHWSPKIEFEAGIKDTIIWYLNNKNRFL